MASPTARTPSAPTTATMVGPDPESVAPYAPACRAAPVTSSYPGAARQAGRDVEHVVEPGGEQSCVAMRQAVDQGGALRGRAYRVRVRQGGRQRGARALRLDGEVRDREHQRK